MTEKPDYKKAYERQKLAREKAEMAMEVRSRELYDANSKIRKAYDKLKKQKIQLVQQEKLASIGLLAAGIAHEINNPVGFVKSNLQSMKGYMDTIVHIALSCKSFVEEIDKEGKSDYEKSSSGKLSELINEADFNFIVEDTMSAISECLEGVAQIEKIVSNLSGFSRSDTGGRKLFQLNSVIDDSLNLARNETKYNIDVVLELSELPEIWGISNEIGQIIVNIIVNAAHAMEYKGLIRIRTYADSSHVYAEITDSGPGIPEEFLNKVFDPFYTSKTVGSGTGLGLYISHGIAKKHKGRLTASNEQDGGAVFLLGLPIDMRDSR